MDNIVAVLSKVQSELKAPKSQRNTFGNYNYRSAEDILEAVKPILAQHNAIITLSDSIEAIGDYIFLKATAVFTCGEASIEVAAYARHASTKKGMDDSQITGSTSSYARKYALNGLLLIDDTKDSDATNKHGKDDTPGYVAGEMFDTLNNLMGLKGVSVGRITAKYGINSISEMTKTQYEDCIANLNATKDKQ